MSRTIDADALLDGYKNMGYDPTEHPEESYMEGWCKGFNAAVAHCMHHVIHAPTIEPEPKPIEYQDCAIALLKMWMDNVLTDGEYSKIISKLNAHLIEVAYEEGEQVPGQMYITDFLGVS